MHLTFVFDERDVARIAALRHRFDPVMAQGVPPHITLAYPEEHGGDIELLKRRAAATAASAGRFTLRCAEVVTDGDDGRGGAFVRIDDPSGGWADLRRAIVAAPFTPVDVTPHLTIVHPRTSAQGQQAWAELQGQRFDTVLAPTAVCLTTTDLSTGLRIDESFVLAGTERALVAAVVLVDGDRVLLGKRSATRANHPGVWDVAGGHVEAAEMPAAAAAREANEELGVDIDNDSMVWVDTVIADGYELVLYATSLWHGAPTNAAPDEHDEIRWFASDEVAGLDLADQRIADVAIAAVARMK